MKPISGMLKCNIDASIISRERKAGIGCVLRNHLGEFIAAGQNVFLGLEDPSLAEAMAVREALSWVKNLSLCNVLFESDALLVVKALNESSKDISYFGQVIDDCRSANQVVMLSSILQEGQCFSICHVRRSANQVAHSLAKAAGSLSDLRVWADVVPHFISDVLLSDMQ